jgi:hypothetical protein
MSHHRNVAEFLSQITLRKHHGREAGPLQFQKHVRDEYSMIGENAITNPRLSGNSTTFVNHAIA